MNEKLIEENRIKEYIKLPVKYDPMGTYIRDAEGKMIAQVRWWWEIQKLKNAEEKQDAIWRLISELLNKHLTTSEKVDISQSDIVPRCPECDTHSYTWGSYCPWCGKEIIWID